MRYSLKLCVLLSVLSLTVITSGCSRFIRSRGYVGHVVLQSDGSTNGICAAPSADARLEKIAALVRSNTVCNRTSKKLSSLGISLTPDEVKKCTSVQVVKGTYVLYLEARSRDASAAKMIADVAASEAISVYKDLNKSWVKKRGLPESKAPKLKIVDPAYVVPAK